jgi:hypothetical protein
VWRENSVAAAQQALGYAETLDNFPSPTGLWQTFYQWKQIDKGEILQ